MWKKNGSGEITQIRIIENMGLFYLIYVHVPTSESIQAAQ